MRRGKSRGTHYFPLAVLKYVAILASVETEKERERERERKGARERKLSVFLFFFLC